MAGNTRWWIIGWPLTNPADGAVPVIVNVASISRRPYAEHVAPKRPPGSSRGPATPTFTGRVTYSSPSFFGYPWWWPRTMAKSLSTQMYTHRLNVSPR